MTINNPIGDPPFKNYYQEYPTHYYNPNQYNYSWPQIKTIKKVVTEREFDKEGRVTKETITDTTETVPYYHASWGGNVYVSNANIPNVEANTAKAVIDNINKCNGGYIG